MTKLKGTAFTLAVAASLVGPAWLLAADEGCPLLKGKDAAAHSAYLRGDRARLSPGCVVAALRYLGVKRPDGADAVLAGYLDYRDRDPAAQRVITDTYPAIAAISAFGPPAAPLLIAVMADTESTATARDNAALAFHIIYGGREPDGIAVLVGAAHAEPDPAAAARLTDRARFFAQMCPESRAKECQDAAWK